MVVRQTVCSAASGAVIGTGVANIVLVAVTGQPHTSTLICLIVALILQAIANIWSGALEKGGKDA